MALDLGYDLPHEENTQAASSESDIAVKIKTKIQNDYVKADIFFQTLNVKSIIERPSMSVSNIQADRVSHYFK